MAQFIEVCKSKIDPDTIDAMELNSCEGVGLKGKFHDSLVVGAKFWLNVGRGIVNSTIDSIEVGH